MKILITIFCLIILPMSSLADDVIKDSPYCGKEVGRIDERGVIYDSLYGGEKIGRVEDGIIYDRPEGGVGR